jgi:RNA polymerase sigma factor for flagellar operon FliA
MTAQLARFSPIDSQDALGSDHLVLQHLPLIQTIARRLVRRLPPSVEVDELVSIGVLGLMDAQQRFDASKGVPFKSYAELRIKGQMLDALRADDMVPRSVRRKNTRLAQEHRQLSLRLGRAPDMSELRNQLDLAPKAFEAYVRDSHIASVTSLDAPASEDSTTPLVESLSLGEDTAEEAFCGKEVRMAVAQAVEQLPEREHQVVTMYYVERRTLREIGELMGVTESRACQIRGQGVKRLKYRLRDLQG